LPESALGRIDARCDRFEKQWQQAVAGGPRPRLEDEVGQTSEPERVALLRELVALELHYRRRLGETPDAGEYRQRFPDLDPDWLERELAAASSVPTQDVNATLPLGARPTAPPSWPAVPGYEVLGELGRGGMGVVFRARQLKLDRLVALKMILAGSHAGPDELARFRTEAEAIARLQHPNIVAVYEVGEHGGLPFFSLEFCPGGSLDRKLAGTPLPTAEAARLVETLARAVQAAHDRHVLHRDLNPANVLLAADGTPKVSDFGLAKKLDAVGHTGSKTAVMGTPPYMAPEQAKGRSKEIGPTTDVYGLGAILYECLTGRPPFKAATSLDTILQVIGEEPLPVRQLQPDVPRDLETICHKCLDKQPTRRYAGARDLADDLGRFLAGKEVLARPLGSIGRAARWVRRRPTATALLAVSGLAALILVAGLVGLLYQSRLQEALDATTTQRNVAEAQRALAQQQGTEAETQRQRAEREKAEANRQRRLADQQRGIALKAKDNAERQRLLAEGQRAEARRQERLAQRYLYVANMNLARRAWLEGNVASTLRLLHRHAPAAGESVGGAGFEWRYLWRLCHADLLTFRHDDSVGPVAFSRDGKRLAVAVRDGTVVVRDTDSGKVVSTLRGHLEQATGLAFSPDGTLLASAAIDGVKLWDPSSDRSRPVRSFTGHLSKVNAVTFRPDGKRVASAGKQTVRVWSPRTGKQFLTLRGHRNDVYAVAYSPDGKWLASASADKTVKVWRASGGRLERTLRGHTDAVVGVSFSPDGKRIASGSWDRTVRVWRRSGKAKAVVLRGHTGPVSAVAFGPDAKRIVSGSWDRTALLWRVEPGATPTAFRGHTDWVTGVAFAPAGDRIASASRDCTVKLWNPRGGQGARTLRLHAGRVTGLAFSLDGSSVISSGADGKVIATDPESGRPPVTFVAKDARPPTPAAAAALPRSLAVAFVFDDPGPPTVGQGLPFRDRICKRNPGGINSLAIDRQGRLVTVREKTRWAEWQIREAGTGRPATAAVRARCHVTQAVFSPDGANVVLAGEDGTARVYRVGDGSIVREMKGHQGIVTSVAYCPDGSRIVTAGEDRTVLVWDARTGNRLRKLTGHRADIVRVAVHPTNGSIVAGNAEGIVTVWDATKPEPTLLLGHVDAVNGLAFSPDGTRLATAGADKVVKLWDTETWQELLALDGHTQTIGCVAFSPDGKRLAAGADDGSVRVWDSRLPPKIAPTPAVIGRAP
jgi:WD40 repeat protein